MIVSFLEIFFLFYLLGFILRWPESQNCARSMHTKTSKRKPPFYPEAQEKLLRTRDQDNSFSPGREGILEVEWKVGDGGELSLYFPFLILYFLSQFCPSSHPNPHHPTSLQDYTAAMAVVIAAAQGPKTPRENSYLQATGPQKRPLCSEEEEYGGNPHFNYFFLPLYPRTDQVV